MDRTNEATRVSFGYLSGFKGDDAVVFSGDSKGLASFATLLDAMADQPVGITRVLDGEPLFLAQHGTRLTLTLTDKHPLGMRRMAGSSTPRLEWLISKSLAKRFAVVIRVLASAPGGAHQYLDAGETDSITVIASKGEYGRLTR